MNEIFEAAMVLCFGASWPLNLWKSVKSKTARGKSLLFEFFLGVQCFVSAICFIASESFSNFGKSFQHFEFHPESKVSSAARLRCVKYMFFAHIFFYLSAKCH